MSQKIYFFCISQTKLYYIFNLFYFLGFTICDYFRYKMSVSIDSFPGYKESFPQDWLPTGEEVRQV